MFLRYVSSCCEYVNRAKFTCPQQPCSNIKIKRSQYVLFQIVLKYASQKLCKTIIVGPTKDFLENCSRKSLVIFGMSNQRSNHHPESIDIGKPARPPDTQTHSANMFTLNMNLGGSFSAYVLIGSDLYKLFTPMDPMI